MPMLVGEIAALMATAIGAMSSEPQLRRVVVTGDTRGVSLSFATLGVVNELTWTLYAIVVGLWSALPAAVVMMGADALLAVVLVRSGTVARPALAAAGTWLVVIAAVSVLAGSNGVAVLLGISYAVQVVPSVWTAYRAPVASGLSATTWTLAGVEAALWGSYGLAHADPATIGLGIVGVLAAAAIVVRTHVTCEPPMVVPAAIVRLGF